MVLGKSIARSKFKWMNGDVRLSVLSLWLETVTVLLSVTNPGTWFESQLSSTFFQDKTFWIWTQREDQTVLIERIISQSTWYLPGSIELLNVNINSFISHLSETHQVLNRGKGHPGNSAPETSLRRINPRPWNLELINNDIYNLHHKYWFSDFFWI